MKTFILLYRDEVPFLRQRNPLEGTRNVISNKAYHEHEAFYNEAALEVINLIPGVSEYAESDIHVIWQFRASLNELWEECSAPEFIETTPDMYRQVFRVAVADSSLSDSFQDKVNSWVQECFGAEAAADKAKRNFRYMEESLELVQSLGMPREDILRLVVHTFGRPAGEPKQEVGGVMVTLAALCAANGLNMTSCGEAEIYNNWKRIKELREKEKYRINA